MSWVVVSLAMNDEFGYESGQVTAVNIHDDDGDVELELESSICTRDMDLVGPVCRWTPGAKKLRVGRLVFPVREFRYHVGNLAWNEFAMRPRDVRRMLDYLQKSRFTITFAHCDSEWLPAHDRSSGPTSTSQADGVR